jgi:Arc/MetJ family transcription regulator
MRTTLDLPEELLEEARRILGFKSKTGTVVLSLTELVRRRRIEELKGLAGQVELELDVDVSRRRPRAGKSAQARSQTNSLLTQVAHGGRRLLGVDRIPPRTP